MATGGKDRQSREQRERARVYQARQELHRRQGHRRRRDNVVGIVLGLLVIAGAVGVQTVYFVAGPGAPTPAPSATDTPSVPTPSDAPLPDLEPTGSPTP
ncbi:dioxygenase [Microbacterium sp. Kw_RZR3]|uniref:dioxygenase n=1 Tax=Microbacterium sp. Kw_RZR3 TaxID=3032903 RepID=UPI0023DAC640|nr:dioxygenase [Microbacterium sp. Kw_RZR3]MDF2047151.1 dioxygenase [Microbacterium sp. Kw_RZR3]